MYFYSHIESTMITVNDRNKLTNQLYIYIPQMTCNFSAKIQTNRTY